MDLVVFSLENYRRFKAKTSVKLYGGMIAIVGPNEAGKISLLTAMTRLDSDEGYERTEESRRGGVKPTLSWQFQLDDDDKQAIKHIHGTTGIEKATVTKGPDGVREWSFEPTDPRRDRSHRKEFAAQFDFLREIDRERTEATGVAAFDQDLLAAAESVLGDDIEDFGEEGIAALLRVSLMLLDVAQAITDEGEGEPNAIQAELAGDIRGVADTFKQQSELEEVENPKVLTRAALEPRLPKIKLFDQADRELGPSYDLNDVADAPPPALMHLASLAGLNLKRMRDDANAGERADVSTHRNNANTRLKSVFKDSWNQREIAIQVDVDGSQLLIQATTPDDDGLSSIEERSDGLRWFAALLAFAYNWPRKIILLADEIETHLHYDAQSDLVDVLAAQEFTAKVIYTTHSFGCLPHDLGNGVRAVKQIDNATSEISNSFWNDGAGFSSLLAVMGAAAVSFTPSRRAVVGEGPGEAILLPTLLRQASGLQKLDFQVVPGIAIVAAVRVSDLETQAGRLAFIVDGDPGGLRNKDKLTDNGITENRIVVLRRDDGSPLELEDLVDPEVYASAASKELRFWNKSLQSDVTAGDLSSTMVTKSVEAWCARNGVKPPDKAAVAQRVVEAANASASKPSDVYAVAHKKRLVAILHQFEEILDSYMSGP